MARPDFRPIIPKRDPFPNVPKQQAQLLAILSNIGRSGQEKLSSYPTAQTPYRRSGELGRKWDVDGPKHTGNDLIIKVGNNAGHAPIVQGPTSGNGPQQSARFKELGWRNVTDVSKEVFNQHKPAIVKVLQGD